MTTWDVALKLQSALESAWRERPPCQQCGKAGKSMQGMHGPLLRHIELHPKRSHIEIVGLTEEGRGFAHVWVHNHSDFEGVELTLGISQS